MTQTRPKTKKIRQYVGERPRTNGTLLASFTRDCEHCGTPEQWELYRKPGNPAEKWTRFKLVAEEAVCHKAGFHLSARASRFPSYFARSRDAGLLQEHRADLYEQVIQFLDGYFPPPEVRGVPQDPAVQRARIEQAEAHGRDLARRAAAPPTTGQSANPDSDYSDLL